jgi:hypothetical protein
VALKHQKSINQNIHTFPVAVKSRRSISPSFEYSLVFFIIFYFIFGVLTPLSAIFKLYHGDQF